MYLASSKQVYCLRLNPIGLGTVLGMVKVQYVSSSSESLKLYVSEVPPLCKCNALEMTIKHSTCKLLSGLLLGLMYWFLAFLMLDMSSPGISSLGNSKSLKALVSDGLGTKLLLNK